MIIVYRACAVGSYKERPIEDKFDLVKTCFGSFRKAFEGLDYNLVVLLDKPTAQFRQIFEGVDTVEETFYSSFDEGNIKSFHRQIELGMEHGGPFLFIEDDYLFLPTAGKHIYDALHTEESEEFFITPYDHPDYYRDERHQYERIVRMMGDYHWGSVSATTLTFGGTRKALEAERSTILSYGWADYPMWCDVTKRTPLYAAIPSLATHMETPHLAPGVNWLENLS